MIYFDNASTTYPKPNELYQELDNANRNYAFNAGRGSYKIARKITEYIDETRELLIEGIGTDKNNVIFTASATQSLNAIIFGLCFEEGDNVYVSPFEHNAIIRTLEKIKDTANINIHIIPFDKENWEVKNDLEDLFALKKPKYILLSSKSNVTGFELPYEEIFASGKKYNSINILDASQTFGVSKVKDSNNIEFIVFAGHKSLYASFGIAGYIYNTKEVLLKETIFGGTGTDTLNAKMPKEFPQKYEAGSPNIVSILGLRASLKWLKTVNIEKRERELTDYLYDKLLKIKKIKIYTPKDYHKCKGILSINIDGYLAEDVGRILDEEFDICVRTGYHCAPHIHEFIDDNSFLGTVRISLGYFNTENEIDKLVQVLQKL